MAFGGLAGDRPRINCTQTLTEGTDNRHFRAPPGRAPTICVRSPRARFCQIWPRGSASPASANPMCVRFPRSRKVPPFMRNTGAWSNRRVRPLPCRPNPPDRPARRARVAPDRGRTQGDPSRSRCSALRASTTSAALGDAVRHRFSTCCRPTAAPRKAAITGHLCPRPHALSKPGADGTLPALR